MYDQRRQQGMTMWGMAMVAVLVVFFLMLLLKLLPPYLQNMKVKTALDNVSKQPNIGALSREEIINMLQRRLDIEDVDKVDLRKDLKIEVKNRDKIIRVAYETRVPMAYNISALLEFDNQVQVRNVE